MTPEMTTERKSSRKAPPKPLPHTTIQLFHHPNLRKFQVLHARPSLLFCKDFISESELASLLEMAKSYEFTASYTHDEKNSGETISTERTSTFLAIPKAHNTAVRAIERRAADVFGWNPTENVEPLQMVSYTKGQEFKLHHDSGTLDDQDHLIPATPRRVATIFVYLTTIPKEAGGATVFPKLGLSVQPIARGAVIWSNVHLKAPYDLDDAVVHQAMPILTAGVRKIGLNIWIVDKL